ncbi:amino acid permease [Pyrofollis japonicus]|uniref:amino acid permease n=1 Tax=Pyrofollis japonicus TaxID=3060460 RepID=UPI0037C74BAE|nr:amino acid permease [Pyrofollis japonicus]
MARGRLGFWEIFSIGVGGMIGGGIFAVLGLSLELVDGAAPLAFFLAGLVALLTSYSYAKLSARFPSEGGTIEFIVQAFGDSVLSGGLNIMLLASYIVMIALYAHAFGSYAASTLSNYRLAYTLLVVFIIALLTLINMLGAVLSGRVELGLVAFKLIVLLSIGAIGFLFVDWSRLSPAHWPSVVNIVAGGMIIFLAYEGFELVSNAAMDASSLTVLRRALYASVVTVISVYILIALVAAGSLSPEIVEEARDYVLAVLAEPVLGKAGYYLVVTAALASTSSAINATLYGTARMSYIVAKYGEAPRVLGKRVWGNAYEGLLIIAFLSLLLALGARLEAISTAGSGGFLLIFTAINYAAYKLRHKTGANPALTLTGMALSIVALATLVYRMASLDPRQLLVFIGIVVGSFIVEAAYRGITGRKLARYIDPRLREREKLIREWEKWLPKLVEEAKKIAKGVELEIRIVGSIARREVEKAGDVDILVVAEKLSEKEARRIIDEAAKRIGLPPHHPLDVHVAKKLRRRRGEDGGE